MGDVIASYKSKTGLADAASKLHVGYNAIPDKYKKFAYGAATAYVTAQYGPLAGKVSGQGLVWLGQLLGG